MKPEEARDVGVLLGKLKDAMREKDKTESLNADYAKRLLESNDDLEALKRLNQDYKAQLIDSKEKADRHLRASDSANFRIKQLKDQLDIEQKGRKVMEQSLAEMNRIQKIADIGREGIDEWIETTRRTKGAMEQANEFYSYSLLLSSRLKEQTRENDRLRDAVQKHEAFEHASKVEAQCLKARLEQLRNGQLTSNQVSKRSREEITSEIRPQEASPLMEMPKRMKAQPTLMRGGR